MNINVIVHPLDGAVVAIAKRGMALDVTSVSLGLMGVSTLLGGGGQAAQKAYRIVAADVLSCMAHAGRLVQVEPWTDERHKERGGALFELADGV